MPVTMRNTDGSELDLADETQTGHSSAMWRMDMGMDHLDYARVIAMVTGGQEVPPIRFPISFFPTPAVLSERERCAKIAESPTGCGEIVTVESGDIKGFSEGMRYACAEIARKIREGA